MQAKHICVRYFCAKRQQPCSTNPASDLRNELQPGGCARFISDDGYAIGPAAVVFDAVHRFAARVATLLDLHVQWGKLTSNEADVRLFWGTSCLSDANDE